MDELREHLLRSGVAPAVVNRYLRELRDHLEDLVAVLTASGLSHTAASDIALRRLGNPRELAAPMLADPAFRSIASRAPLAAWLGLPLLAMAGLAALFASVVVFAVRNGLPLAHLGDAATILLLIAPIAIGWAISADARRRRAKLAWPGLGIAATIALGAAMKMEVDEAAIVVSLTAPAWPQLAVYALLTFVPLVLTQRRTI